MLIGFESGDNLIQLGNLLWAEDVQRREVKRNSPVGWRASFETDLSDIRDSGHVSLLVTCSIFDLEVRDAITMLVALLPNQFPCQPLQYVISLF